MVPKVLELFLCRRVGGVGETSVLGTGGKTSGIQRYVIKLCDNYVYRL